MVRPGAISKAVVCLKHRPTCYGFHASSCEGFLLLRVRRQGRRSKPVPWALGAVGLRHGLSSWCLLRGSDRLVLASADATVEEAL